MSLIEILALIVLVTAIWLFWQSRVMAESAKAAIAQYCAKYGLQLLSVARTSLKASRNQRGNFCLRANYQFEFSSDGESYYLGTLTINGHQVVSIDTPAYRQN